ncbi:polysaccharide biosynthesis/export family protein [Mucilaginibacter calamicampi]|uniref:Polysaccharide biosynthesis/export family protein n=1 Tax=Mucilaginibacter calamicampi TaxID=1302352 RepID=A0ABW2YYV1_9SPHI
MKLKFHLFSFIVITMFLGSLLSSCISGKQLAYFNNIKNDSVSTIEPTNFQTVISKNDILQIDISTPDPVTTARFNTTGTNGRTEYLVDETGVIKLPYVGAIKAEGLNKKQLADFITNALVKGEYAKEPVVSVRVINYFVTVLGEVVRPGNVPVPNERITLPEALAAAGDLTAYGRRNDVLLVREANGKRIYKHIDLNKGQMFDPDVYNLQNQDKIYVSPSRNRAASVDRTGQLVSIVASVVSLVLVVYVQFIK